MTTTKDDTSAIVSGFLARGGEIQKCPEALPTTADDVVRYLESQNVSVEPASDKNKPDKFTCSGEVVDLSNLIQIANRLRRKQRRPPFEMAATSRRHR